MIRSLLLLAVSLSSVLLCAQSGPVTISGIVRDSADKSALAYVNVMLLKSTDSAFVMGTVTDEEGRFAMSGVAPDHYVLKISLISYATVLRPLYVGSLSDFLDLSAIELVSASQALEEVVIQGKQEEVSGKMDKKTFSVEDNTAQAGGSALQVMQNLPGITVEDGKLMLRGNDKVVILIDGKQTALTGFGNAAGLDNIPASSIEKIEIINNPSSRYDANGNGGIINIILRKNRQDGFSGRAGLSLGAGALWVRRENLPTIRPQYQFTPKLNPSLSLSYRKKRMNLFVQADDLYTQTLNKNEFVTRTYDDGTVIRQQLKRNRNTNFLTARGGVDWHADPQNLFTLSCMYGSERIFDRGDQPFFNSDLSERLRLWQFLEDELKTTVMASGAFQHKFKQAGHQLDVGYNYTFHREDEKYFFDNILPGYTGRDAFKLLSDEHVSDVTLNYVKPLRFGKAEAGAKFRQRAIPTDMQFFPSTLSPLDSAAGGKAVYRETIPALFASYSFDLEKMEAELGLRAEHVAVRYEVNPNHNTYRSDGYSYTQPFPSVRLGYRINEKNKLSVSFNRRVDRPNEVDIRIFPKYDDAEIIKVGNPALQPQFTNSLELGHKMSWTSGYMYTAAYHRMANGTITRISTIVPGSTLIYAIFQNAGRSQGTGLEAVLSQDVAKWWAFTLNANFYRNRIEAFSVYNLYPEPHTFSADAQEALSGNVKLNSTFHLPKRLDIQLTAIYQAPDIIPQGKIAERFSLDVGVKKSLQKGNGELFVNGTDLLNSLVIRKTIQGNGFSYVSQDYYETQVVRVGYIYKFNAAGK